jgi:hypothetical protein
MTLEGKVAAIVSVREVAINLGDRDHVEPGMIFAILADVPLRVEDPDTRELLAEIERYKVKVKVTEVLERLSICRTYETYETGGMFPSSFASLIAGMSGPATRHVRTLKIEDSELPPPLSEEESYVKVGDRVRQVPSQD